MIIDKAEILFKETKKLLNELDTVYKFIEMVERYCPESVGLEDAYGVFDCDDADCYECWRQALKKFIGRELTNA